MLGDLFNQEAVNEMRIEIAKEERSEGRQDSARIPQSKLRPA